MATSYLIFILANLHKQRKQPLNPILKLSFLAVLIGLLAGCATVTKGPKQAIPVTSEPAGAHVLSGDRVLGVTPMRAYLARNQAHTVEIEKAGYRPQSIEVRPYPNEAASAYVRFGFDRMIGANHDLDVTSIHVELDPDILPTGDVRGRVRELAAKVVEVDTRLHNGEIGEAEHGYLIRRLVKAYGH